MLEDGTINPGEMTSFNHYALGAVADWMHRRRRPVSHPAEAGYRRLLVAPRPLERLRSASARHLTPYGTASAGWVREGDTVTVSIVVPPNSDASVILPGAPRRSWSDRVRTAGRSATRTPPQHRSELSLDSSLSEIIDDPKAFAVVAAAIAGRRTRHQALTFRKHTKWTPGRELGESVRRTPPPVVAAVESALAT